MITLNKYKEIFGDIKEFTDYPEEYLENMYRQQCLQTIRAYFNVFLGDLEKNSDEEALYKWGITLETIFDIQQIRNEETNQEA